LKTIEVIDNGSGIAPENYESVGKWRSLAPNGIFFVILFGQH
jgi:hypothetical protein